MLKRGEDIRTEQAEELEVFLCLLGYGIIFVVNKRAQLFTNIHKQYLYLHVFPFPHPKLEWIQ